MPVETVYSVRTTRTGSIYDIGGVKTAFPNILNPECGQTNSATPDEAYRSFFYFPTANVLPAGAVLTQVIWEVKLNGFHTSTLGTTIINEVHWGQPFIEDPLATSDWAEGLFGSEEFGGFSDGDLVVMQFEPTDFDVTKDFDMSVWDVSTNDSDPNFDVYVQFWNGAIPARQQQLHLYYSLAKKHKGYYTLGG